ncbi:MAG TPA: HD domain-containing phosphohydrolase [Thermoanaerobaculia bacterium]|nr:HD domain-containing phosphohydrolase [Thermoanaerobaculia bacterium]
MDRLTLLHSKSFPIERYADALARESIELIAIDSIASAAVQRESLNVLLLDQELAGNGRPIPGIGARTVIIGIGLATSRKPLAGEEIYLNLPEDPPPGVLLNSVRRGYEFVFQRVRADELEEQLRERNQELKRINEIGMALSTVRDHSVLLDMILSKSRELSRADAGSLYLLDEIHGVGKVLRWKLAQNDSIAVDFEEKVLPITKKSLAGFVALTGETLVIDDAYELPTDVEYSINRSFDLETGYRTRSMLVFPMTNHVGDLIGVLQLINRKRPGAPAQLTAEDVPREVIPFDQHTIDLMRSLAGQAAVAVENNLLYESIERLFEGFVTAAVTAIEQRDPTTSGHSFRVADFTVGLARALDGLTTGGFRNVHFSTAQIKEIRYASLLHDFGKVGVREQVLVKEKKLYPLHLDAIRLRFEFSMRSIEAAYSRRKLDYLLADGPEGFDRKSEELDAEMKAEIARLQRDLEVIIHSNEPTILPEGDFQYLQGIATRGYQDVNGEWRLLLTPDEARILSIRKGNLDSSERDEIESHVTHTFEFLSKIPWTRDLRAVPDYAYAHHEKLNGRGYPRKLLAEQIPLQSRMMTVSDIFDALTAADRPYKKAITTERALDILKMEVADGLLDSALVDVFIEAKIWEKPAS